MNKLFKLFMVLCFCSMLPMGLDAQTLQMTTDSLGQVGYKNTSGQVVIPCTYTYGEPFSASGLAKVGKNEVYGLIKTDGTFVLPLEYSEIAKIDGTECFCVKKNGSYGMVDSKTGNIIIPVKYSADEIMRVATQNGGKLSESKQREYTLKEARGTVRHPLTDVVPESEWDF